MLFAALVEGLLLAPLVHVLPVAHARLREPVLGDEHLLPLFAPGEGLI